MARPQYKRVLVKVSGESLCSAGGWGIEAARMSAVADELAPLVDMGVQVGLVVGGGNLIRGHDLAERTHVRRATADSMGMLATVINGLALRDALESRHLPACVMTAAQIAGVGEPFLRRKAIAHLEAGQIVIFAGGTGNPFFTTDTCAALRALEIDAEVLLKATKVDGVYGGDPVKSPDARRYDRLTYQKVLSDRLGVMDLAAVSMCMETKLPIIVFQLSKAGSLAAAVCGRHVGTTIRD